MPGRYSTRRRRGNRLGAIVNSNKNMPNGVIAVTSTNVVTLISSSVTAPSNTVAQEVGHGSIIKAIWLSLDFCGLAASGVNQRTMIYLFKNPGNNLTPPGGFAIGTSNEKKYVIKTWSAMTMRNQEGNPPYHWEGWVKIPKLYQRQGVDDQFQLIAGANTATGHFNFHAIYKWYS